MICTRPNVSYALNVTSKYKSDPSESHWVAVKNILKYLRKTKDVFLIYGDRAIDLHVKGYMNASFKYDRYDSKSQSSYAFTLNGRVFNCKSSKQETTVDSTTEVEYIDASNCS